MQPPSSESTKKMASFISATHYGDLPREVVSRTKGCLLDWIGSAYAGKGSPTDTIVFPLVREMGGRKVAALVGSKDSAPPVVAALYNGTISAVMEIDDVHEEAGIHAGIGVIPAALATADYVGASGRDLITSVVIGYDVTVRMARAAGPSHYQFWHSTGTCNAFGAAAAAGRLLHLDPHKMTMALGLSGTQASGFWESLNREATMAKHLHSGKAASNGVFSALLAGAGFRGSESIIEGEKGFLAASSEATEQDKVKLTDDFGEPFLIMRNFFKKYACCRACFEGIEGIHQILRTHHVSHREIEKISVTMKPMRTWMVGNENPRNPYEAKFSLPFCMALMALHGEAGLYQFNEENLHDPALREFMEKIKIHSDPDIVPKARLEVVCKDRSVFAAEPLCQSLNLDEVRDKFIKNSDPLLRKKQIDNILSSIEGLEAMDKITELTRVLNNKTRRSIG